MKLALSGPASVTPSMPLTTTSSASTPAFGMKAISNSVGVPTAGFAAEFVADVDRGAGLAVADRTRHARHRIGRQPPWRRLRSRSCSAGLRLRSARGEREAGDRKTEWLDGSS